MAITIASVITNLDTYLGDSSTDRISQAERFQAITEATGWLSEELGNEHGINTFVLNYFDTVNYYKVTTSIADLLTGADLRREKDDHNQPFSRKSARELAAEVGHGSEESSWAIERRDGDAFLAVNHASKHSARSVSSLDSTTAGGGTWELDTTNSDATNLTVDSVEFKQGTASLNFDIDVSQSGNDFARIKNTALTSLDLSKDEDLSSWLLWVYIPVATEFSSVTIYWGSDSSNYWSNTATTDVDGGSFVDGWNRVKVDWSGATKTASPDVTAIDFLQIDLNYTASQGDDTDYRVDELLLVRPEKLTFHYLSWNVGTNTGGTDVTNFAATTDIPFYSGQYDQYRYAVAHKAASILFYSMRLRQDAQLEEIKAERSLDRYRKLFSSPKAREVKSFKVLGVSFRKHR